MSNEIKEIDLYMCADADSRVAPDGPFCGYQVGDETFFATRVNDEILLESVLLTHVMLGLEKARIIRNRPGRGRKLVYRARNRSRFEGRKWIPAVDEEGEASPLARRIIRKALAKKPLRRDAAGYSIPWPAWMHEE